MPTQSSVVDIDRANQPAVRQKRAARPTIARLVETPSEAPARRIVPTVEDIRERAYFIYLNRCANGVPGNAESDWHQAVAELNGAG